MVLLCARLWWPSSARLALAFLRHGFRVSAAVPSGNPIRHVTGLDALYPYQGMRALSQLKSAILTARPELIVPCDDATVWDLHALHEQSPELRPLIERSIGSSHAYPIIRSRNQVLQSATKLGIRVPRTLPVTSEEDLKDWPADAAAVLKLDGTWGGAGVVIVDSRQEAIRELRKSRGAINAGRMLKRWLIDGDPIPLWPSRRRAAASLTVQEFIHGRPATTMVACWEGEVLAIVTAEVLASQGATGSAIAVLLSENEEIERAARLMVKEFGLSGFHGLDFMLEEKTGAAWLIELNARATQLGHLRLPGQGDLAGFLAAQLRNEPMPEPTDCVRERIVALYPQALNQDTDRVYLFSGYHDVPWEEPALRQELLRDPWPKRRVLSRVYHYFRPSTQRNEAKQS